VHANFGPLFGPLSEEGKAAQIEKLGKKFAFIEKDLLTGAGKGQFLVGGKFSIADSYLYIVLGWGRWVGVDLSAYPAVKAYWEGIDQLPQVVAAHAKIATNPSSI
jgi:glutathione S-transferase